MADTISSLSDLMTTTSSSEPNDLDNYDEYEADNDIANNIERETKELIDSSEVSDKKKSKTNNNKSKNKEPMIETKMNIVEAYLKKRKQLVILISGFSGCGKSVIAKNIAKDFNIEYLNLNNFMKEDYAETTTPKILLDKKIIDWDDPTAINWDEFNNKINEIKNKGVIVSGFGFPSDKLQFHTHYHIHLKISKDLLLKNRKEYKLENADTKLENIDEELEKKILNNISYPHYIEILGKSKVNTTIQVGENLKETYDSVFDNLIEFINDKVYSNK